MQDSDVRTLLAAIKVLGEQVKELGASVAAHQLALQVLFERDPGAREALALHLERLDAALLATSVPDHMIAAALADVRRLAGVPHN